MTTPGWSAARTAPSRVEGAPPSRVRRRLGGRLVVGGRRPAAARARSARAPVAAAARRGRAGPRRSVGGGAGADPHRGQPEQPVDRRGGQVDGADPVDRRRQHVPVEQPAPQLDPAAGDPEAGGQVAQQAERDRDRDAEQLPPLARRPRCRPRAKPISTGRKRITSRTGCTSSIRGSSRCHSASRRSRPAPAAGRRRSGSITWRRPRTASALSVSSSTSRGRASWSSPAISSAPAAEAVVTRDRGQPEQPRDRALDVVDGLDPRHRRDPALAGPPAGLGVDRGVGDLPAVHEVAPLRHHHDVRREDQRRAAPAPTTAGRTSRTDRPATTSTTSSTTRLRSRPPSSHISRARGLTRWLGSRRRRCVGRIISP